MKVSQQWVKRLALDPLALDTFLFVCFLGMIRVLGWCTKKRVAFYYQHFVRKSGSPQGIITQSVILTMEYTYYIHQRMFSFVFQMVRYY